MRQDVLHAASSGAHGVVLGVLTASGGVDQDALRPFVELCAALGALCCLCTAKLPCSATAMQPLMHCRQRACSQSSTLPPDQLFCFHSYPTRCPPLDTSSRPRPDIPPSL